MYTFSYPLLIGAILAGNSRKERTRLMNLGKILGRAFQIQDDLKDYLTTNKRGEKGKFNDISSGKRTLPLLLMYKRASMKDQRFLRNCLNKKILTHEEKEKLMHLIKQPQILKRIRKEIHHSVQSARRIIHSLSMKQSSKKKLLFIIQSLFTE